jgi:hypothetical protein
MNPSPKEAAENQIRSELCKDSALAALVPTKQNADTPAPVPRIAVVASPGTEYATQSGIWNIPVAVEMHWRKETPAEQLDSIVSRIYAQLLAAQARGDYGLIFQGEPATSFVGDTIRKRIVNVTLIAAVVAA